PPPLYPQLLANKEITSRHTVSIPVSSSKGRCFRSVDFVSDGHRKLISIDEETNHHVVHAFRLGKTDRPTYQPLDPRPQIDVLALDLLRIFLPHCVLLCLHMPLVGPPAVGEIPRDAKRLQQRLALQKDGVLASSKYVGQHLARVVMLGSDKARSA